LPSISVPTAIIGSAVIGGAATAIGASSAAGAQRDAAARAQKTQMDMFGQSKELLKPYSDQGLEAYGTLNKLLGVGGSEDMTKTLESLPGYQFTLDQGLKSTQSGYAAKGLGNSGAALKGAANYSTGLAQGYYDRYANQLRDSSQIGANAASSLAGNALQTGQGVASSQIGAGNATAGAATATGNAFGSTAGTLGQYYTLRNLLDSSGATNNSNDPRYFYGGG
jgi:hypothetical protein